MLSFLRKFPTVLQSGCTILHSRQQCMRVPVVPHPWQHLVLSSFQIIAIINRCAMTFYCCFNLHFPDGMWCGESFICLFVTCISSFGEVSKVFDQSKKIVLFSYFWVFRIFCTFLLNGLLSDIFCKYFLPVCGLSPHSLDIVFCRVEVFHFNEVQLINYFFWICLGSIFAFGVVSEKSSPYPRPYRIFLCYLLVL